MATLLYDGSFEGLLSAFVTARNLQWANPVFQKQGEAQPSLFDTIQSVSTSETDVAALLKELKHYLPAQAMRNFFTAFFSQVVGLENYLWQYATYALRTKRNIDTDFSHPAVLAVHQLSRKVMKERHRMEAFIRFKRTTDDIYYATIAPDYDVIPLLLPHFRKRYADQRWLIYDMKRKYGVAYDLLSVEIVAMDHDDFKSRVQSSEIQEAMHHQSEAFFQQLWKTYFKNTGIAARKNTKLHVQHMPKRYWKYLIEKQ